MVLERALDRSPRWLRRWATGITRGRGLLGAVYDRVAHPFSTDAVPELPPVPTTPVRLVIGPANTAGQGYEWARSVERSLPDVSALAVMGLGDIGFGAHADVRMPSAVYLRSSAWHRAFEQFLGQCTHVIIESALPLLGRRYGTDVAAEVAALRDAGLQVALIFHGSDVRVPSQHQRENPWSPFAHPQVPSTILEDKTVEAIAAVAALEVAAFVSTPDLLRYVPGSIWCPLAIDVARWRTDRTAAERSADRLPVVLHAPSKPLIKGSHRVEPVLLALEAEGLIEYRRLQGVAHGDMPRLYAEADIVLDQFLIGSYGVAACEAMAAGCVVIGHVDEVTRRSVVDLTATEVPIVEATVDSLDHVLRSVIAEPVETTIARRESAVRFVESVHDGRRSAESLRGFLGV